MASHSLENVVSIGGEPIRDVRIQPPADARVDLLGSVETQLIHGVGALAAPVFERIDDLLFDLADKALSVSDQERYLAGMREVRLRREAFFQRFGAHLQRGFGSAPAPRPTLAFDASRDQELSLIGEEEMETTLAFTSMADGASQRCTFLLAELGRRITYLQGRSEGGYEVEDLPIAPRALVDALAEAAKTFATTLEIRLIFFKLFDKYVMRHLATVYQGINQGLIGAGILPKLKPLVAPTAGGSTAEGRGEPPAAHPVPGPTPSSPQPAGPVAGDPPLACAAPPAAPLPALPVADGGIATAELIRLLGAVRPTPVAGATGAAVVHVLPWLAERLHDSEHAAQAALGASQQHVIRTVEILFEYILDDRNLHPRIRAALGRLQLAMVKAALLDKAFFQRRNHPARRFLNELAGAGIGVGDDHQGQALCELIEHTVEQALDRFGNDVGVFETLREELAEQYGQQEDRQRTVAEREAKTIAGRERRLMAEQTVDRLLAEILATPEVPPALEQVFSDLWRQHLLLSHLQGGEQGDAYRRAVQATRNIVRSVIPLREPTARQTAVESAGPMLRGVRDALRQGLLGDEAQRHRFLQSLQELHFRALKTGDPTPASGSTDLTTGIEDPITSAPDATNGGVEAFEQPRGDTADDPFLRRARELPEGTWMELAGEHGAGKRIKLSWRSGLTGRMLFVNGRGVKELECTAEALADRLRQGRIQAVDSRPLFDRMMGVLRN